MRSALIFCLLLLTSQARGVFDVFLQVTTEEVPEEAPRA